MRKVYFLLLWLLVIENSTNAQTVTIGNGSETAYYSPWSPFYGYSYVQTIYLKSEINAVGNITSVRFYATGSLSSSDQIKVYMGHVARSSFSSTTNWEPASNLTVVYDGTLTGYTVPGWVTITLSTPFTYNNVDNLLIAVDENKSNYDISTSFAGTTIGTNRVLRYASDSNNPDPISPPTGTRVSVLGNIQIDGLTLTGCQLPTSVSTSSTTSVSSTAAWTAPAGGSAVTQYNWELRTSGAAGSGATGLVNSGNAATTSINLSSLTPITNYSFYVRTDCGSGSYSAWSSVHNFTTTCASVGLPYTLDFNAITAPALPTCVTKQDVNNDTYSWATFTPSTPTVNLPTTLVRYSYNADNATIGADDWLFTQGLNLTSGTTYQLKFKYKASNGPTYIEKLEVKYGTSNTAAAMTSNAIFSNTNIASALADAYTDANVTFTVPSSGIYYLGLHAFSDPDQAYLYVDDIVVQVLATCDQPSALTPSALTGNSATVSWTPPAIGTITNYSWELRTSGIAGSGATGLANSGNTTATSVNLTSLAGGTTYTFYVRTNCVNPDASSYNSATFATPIVNDDCTGAIVISAYGAVNGTTIGATQSQAAEACGTYTGNANDDVWYKFTTSQNGDALITLTPIGTSFDAVMMAYSGSCGALTNIACADATAGGGTEVLSLTGLIAGQTYYFRVYGYGSSGTEGAFAITAAGAALPVSISSFKGERQGANNFLSWTTVTETNNNGFELQRSADGVNFSSLGFIASKASNGNSNAVLTYAYTDTKSLIAGSYYRLKQVDKDGKSSLSQVVFIKGTKVNKLELVSIYPNPAIDKLNIALVAPKADNITFVVSDLTGKVIIRQLVAISNGDNNINVNVSTLAKGTYTIKAICADGCETAISKFVKQ